MNYKVINNVTQLENVVGGKRKSAYKSGYKFGREVGGVVAKASIIAGIASLFLFRKDPNTPSD